MGEVAEVGSLSMSSVKAKSWQLVLSPWSAEQRETLRRFGADESFASLFGLRSNDDQLECFFTFKASRRVLHGWLHISSTAIGNRRLRQSRTRSGVLSSRNTKSAATDQPKGSEQICRERSCE